MSGVIEGEERPSPPLGFWQALILISGLILLGFVFTFVIPAFDRMFEEMGFRDALPMPTFLLVKTSRMLNVLPGVVFLPAAGMGIFYIRVRRGFLRTRDEVSEQIVLDRVRWATEARWISWAVLLLLFSMFGWSVIGLLLPLHSVLAGADM